MSAVCGICGCDPCDWLPHAIRVRGAAWVRAEVAKRRPAYPLSPPRHAMPRRRGSHQLIVVALAVLLLAGCDSGGESGAAPIYATCVNQTRAP